MSSTIDMSMGGVCVCVSVCGGKPKMKEALYS